MTNKQNKRGFCPLCNLPFEKNKLVEHYLSDVDLVAYVRRVHSNWNGLDAVCARCLEYYKQEMDSQSHISVIESELSGEQTVITAQEEGAIKLDDAAEEACLLVIHGANIGKRYDLNKKELIIGRSDKADIAVNDENVSRQHAKINVGKKDVIISDLDSTNGTFVNTKKVPTKVLVDGDLVLIGNTILKFISGSNVESIYHKEIYKLATIDGLTQVYNKAFINERLAEEFRRSRRYQRDLSLVMFDFDHFKSINDDYGHPTGDYILKQTASIIMKNMRKEDIFGRFGGEEFTIIFLETPNEAAVKIAEKFRKLIEQEVFRFEGHELKVTVSMGVASMNGQLTSQRELLKLADQALYRAKSEGRNRVCSI